MIVCRLTNALLAGLSDAGATNVAIAARGPAVPRFDIARSCGDADKFSTGSSKGSDYRGCVLDETQARAELVKRGRPPARARSGNAWSPAPTRVSSRR